MNQRNTSKKNTAILDRELRNALNAIQPSDAFVDKVMKHIERETPPVRYHDVLEYMLTKMSQHRSFRPALALCGAIALWITYSTLSSYVLVAVSQ